MPEDKTDAQAAQSGKIYRGQSRNYHTADQELDNESGLIVKLEYRCHYPVPLQKPLILEVFSRETSFKNQENECMSKELEPMNLLPDSFMEVGELSEI